jgi:hypothetical protein
MTRGTTVVAALATVLVLLAAGSAHAHAILERDDATLAFRATDFVSHNTVTVSMTGGSISMVDAAGVGGLDPGVCRPGRVGLQSGYVIEGICPRGDAADVRINVGEREDDVVADIAMPVQVIAGGGIDHVRTGAGDDNLDGGTGGDRLEPGAGEDLVRGADGDDTVLARDGVRDVITCGPGRDAVEADPIDAVASDCELATPAAFDDQAGPELRVAADTRQRLVARPTIRASADEPVRFVAQAAIEIGATTLALRPGRGILAATPGAVALRPELSAREVRIARRALRAGRAVRLVVSVVGTDRTGNSSLRNVRTIQLVL